MKWFTSFCLIGCVLVLASYPWTVGKPPKAEEPRAVRQAYAVRSAGYFGLIVLTLTGAAVGSALILRKARNDYREQSKRNFEHLVQAKASADSQSTTPHEPPR